MKGVNYLITHDVIINHVKITKTPRTHNQGDMKNRNYPLISKLITSKCTANLLKPLNKEFDDNVVIVKCIENRERTWRKRLAKIEKLKTRDGKKGPVFGPSRPVSTSSRPGPVPSLKFQARPVPLTFGPVPSSRF